VAVALVVTFGVLAFFGNQTSLELYHIGLTSKPIQTVPAICRSLFSEVAQIRSVLAEQSKTLSNLEIAASDYDRKWDNPNDNKGFGNPHDPGPGYLNWQKQLDMVHDERKDFNSTVVGLTQAIEQMQQKCNF
jgi:hypothetical protein